jgi:ribosomal-protein-alanine N-acetyltransferase
MTAEDMAALHARAFAGQGRGWSAAEFRALRERTSVLAVCRPRGFALGQLSGDEAEILTIATDPDHRRTGIGCALLAGLEDAVQGRGAARIVLEVAETNGAARALYDSAGYRRVARRPRYYELPNGGRADALVLEKHLSPA